MQMATNLTNSTHSESTFSLTLTSKCFGFQTDYRNSHYRCVKIRISPLRYMNISDEWETPEKQPFKDFVSNYFLCFPPFFFILKYCTGHRHFIYLFREICATGLRIQTVVTNTA